MFNHGKSFHDAQRAYDNMEPEGDDDLNSSPPVDGVAWDDTPPAKDPKNAEAWCKLRTDGRWKATGWAKHENVYLEADAFGESKSEALFNLKIEMLWKSMKCVGMVMDAVDEIKGEEQP